MRSLAKKKKKKLQKQKQKTFKQNPIAYLVFILRAIVNHTLTT